jgi:drug/metabolite transporter (DMT)-like permease
VNLIVNYGILVIMGFLAAISSYFFKVSISRNVFKDLLLCKYLYAGIFLYVIAALLNVYLLQVMPYSVVVPLCSITYIWTLLVSFKLLGEKISLKKIFGVATILVGAICVSI